LILPHFCFVSILGHSYQQQQSSITTKHQVLYKNSNNNYQNTNENSYWPPQTRQTVTTNPSISTVPNNHSYINHNGSSIYPPVPSGITYTSSSSVVQQIQQPQHSNRLINDAVDNNLTELVLSNNPVNPFSPYGYYVAQQQQQQQQQQPLTSPNISNHHHHLINSNNSVIFSPKRGTNPFDDDLIRR